MVPDVGSPASSGKVARTIGAAPRNPTQETNVFSGQLILKGISNR